MEARKKTKIGPELYKCPLCKQIIYTGKRSIDAIQMKYPEAIAGRMDVDHIEPVIAIEESGKKKDWNKIITRMFCPESNVQCICWLCHKSKSLSERGEREVVKKINRNNGDL